MGNKISNTLSFYVILLLQCYFTEAQAQWQNLKSNVPLHSKLSSPIIKHLEKKYQLLITYKSYSGWHIGETNDFHALALGKHSWNKIIVSFPKSDIHYLTKPSIKVQALKRRTIKLLLATLNDQQFWSLNNDSLHIHEQKPKSPVRNSVVKDTLVIMGSATKRFEILDGTGYIIELITKNNYRIYTSYEPESYLTFFPEIKTTRRFIISKNAIEKILFYKTADHTD